MIDFTQCHIALLDVHHIGNKTQGEELLLSDSLLDITDDRLRELLLQYFCEPFSEAEFYAFTFADGDHTMNPVYQYATSLFEDRDGFSRISANIAQLLYEVSLHPQIKNGDLFVAYFTNVKLDGVFVDALGIFKAENRQPFLKVDNRERQFAIAYEDGIDIEKLDKGCIIFDTEAESGLKLCVVDKANKSGEAQYWKEQFLHIRPLNDDYHYTKDILSITKNFVTRQFDKEFEVNKADQIDLLNRSVDYFKSHEHFEREDFEKEVFRADSVIASFRSYDNTYREEHDIELIDEFEISAQAVKKQARIFKSVLKLDKNFHVYIHGDRSLIEQGEDADGRKFYKLYYDNEA